MFFSLPRLYLTLTTIKTSEFSTLGRCILKRVRFRYKIVRDKSFEKANGRSIEVGVELSDTIASHKTLTQVVGMTMILDNFCRQCMFQKAIILF